MPKQKVITHLIIGLAKGGAETKLYNLVKYKTNQALCHKVISLGVSSYYEKPLEELGVEVIVLPLQKKPFFTIYSLIKHLFHAKTVCCWMYHANFIGLILGKCLGCRVICNILHTYLNKKNNNINTIIINKITALLSYFFELITYEGQLSKKIHEKIGYSKKNGVIFDNGCDPLSYTFLPDSEFKIRAELLIPSNKKIILSVARDHPIKDIPTFIEAFRLLHTQVPETIAVMCGSGIDSNNTDLCLLLKSVGLQLNKDIFLLGMRHDIPTLFSACDLYVLHSAGEAFPNTLLQAMSCSTLCLSTDVGDARRILNNDECIIPPCKPNIMAETMQKMLGLPQKYKLKIRLENRERIINHFDIRQIVKKYEDIFLKI